MRTLFVDDPPKASFLPWTHVKNGIALNQGVNQTATQTAIPGAMAAVHPQPMPAMNPKAKALMAGWMKKKAEIFNGKYHIPDSEDVDTVSHYDWYEATGFKVPFPGEKTVRPASDFNRTAPDATADLDD
jgi:hypothetical protein